MAGVLLVDDSAGFRALCARLLADHGLAVAGEAADAEAAVRLAAARRPDAVLLDVHLGRDDGWAVARALATLDPPPARVVMVSSEAAAGDPALVHAAGVHAFVAKDELALHDLGALLGLAVAR